MFGSKKKKDDQEQDHEDVKIEIPNMEGLKLSPE